MTSWKDRTLTEEEWEGGQKARRWKRPRRIWIGAATWESYLQSSEQLAAVLYPGDVKKLIDGSVGQLGAKLCVSLDGVQDLVFILGSSHLKKDRDTDLIHKTKAMFYVYMWPI